MSVKGQCYAQRASLGKGRHLEAGTVYQGAPAEVSSVEQAPLLQVLCSFESV